MANEERGKVYPPGLLDEGNFYGYPKEIWDSFSDDQKQAAATVFAMAYPGLAIAAWAQEALAYKSMSLKAENLPGKTTG